MGILRWTSLRINSLIRRIKLRLGLVDEPPLREFVYLDETAVISLIASTTGGVTEQQSTLKRSQISSSITSNLSAKGGAASAGLGSSISATQEKSSEVVRRYVIQSNFTELYDLRKDDLRMSDQIDSQDAVIASSPNNTTDSIDSLDGLYVQKQNLERGHLIELDVKLGSHDIYKIYKALDLFYDIFESLPNWSEVSAEMENENVSVDDFEKLIELIDKFLTGLVPIVGHVQNYGLVHKDDEAHIYQKSTLDAAGIEYETISIVGFVEEDKLWEDSSRFLFEESEYTAYCRVEDVKVSDEWVPLKLMDVVESISSETSESIQNLPEMFRLDSTNGSPSVSKETNQELVREEVEQYIDRVTENSPGEAKVEILDEVVQTVEAGPLDIDSREAMLMRAKEKLEEQDHDLVSEEDERRIKTDILVRESEEEAQFSTASDADWFLDVNFISIYW